MSTNSDYTERTQMKSVDETLEERGEVYGDYKGGSEFRATVTLAVKNRFMAVHGREMGQTDLIHIYDIINKLSRLAVTPDHKDSWHDIAGYAKLIEETL